MLKKNNTAYHPAASKMLATFIEPVNIDSDVDLIKKRYTILHDKIFVLRLKETQKVLLTYNVDSFNIIDRVLLGNTIIVNRNKKTNTLYTINAVKKLTKINGDNINWDLYQNSLLILEDNVDLKVYTTEILAVISSRNKDIV